MNLQHRTTTPLKTFLTLAAVAMACVTMNACGGSASPVPTGPTPLPTTIVLPMGVDYGLKRQCIRTAWETLPNFFVDNVDCPGSAYPTSRYWLTVVEIETFGIGGSCVGANDQSVLINGPGSPATEHWQGNSSSGYTVELKADYSNLANACAPPTYTALSLIDNAGRGGGPLPRPDQLRVDFSTNFNRTLATNAGGVHAGVEMSAIWLVAGSSTPIHVSLQIDFFYDPTVACCPLPPGMPPDVLAYGTPTAGYPVYTIDLDASKLNPPILVPLGTTTPITINWGDILAHVIAENLVPPPVSGWGGSSAATGDSIVSLEIRNNLSGPGGPMADLFVTNYRESGVFKAAR